MPIEYAVKYAKQIDERFTLGALTAGAVNNNVDFVGVQTVRVYDIPTAAMHDYTLTGSSRYGAPEELGNSTQELTLTRDRSFTFTIDRRSNIDTQGSTEAGSALSRQIDEVVIPEVDIYRLSIMTANAGKIATAAITPSNAYSALLDASVWLADNKCPTEGRIAFITPTYYKNIKLDSNFIKASDLSQNMLIRGQVGVVDNIRLILTPSSYLPAGVEFLVTHQIATVAAQKLSEYKTHDNPPGINGWLVEGRIYYDAFVLKNKKSVIYVHKKA